MSTNSKLMAAVIFAFVSCASFQAQEVEEVIKVDVSLVTVNVNVSDGKGRPLASLKAQDFQVTDQGQKVALGFFENQGPASIVFVLDMSSSMRGSKWRNLKEGLKEFLARAPEGNDYTLVVFSDRARVISHAVRAGELWQNLNGLQPYGHTALYDAVLLGLKTMDELPQHHKTLVLISDGEDNSSHAGLPAVQQEVLTRRTTIYTVGILPDDLSFVWYGKSGKQLLSELAATTGGLVHFPSSGEVDEVLKKINADVSNQYSLGYYPPDKTRGWRQIQVNLAQDTGRLKLRYQQRYLIK